MTAHLTFDAVDLDGIDRLAGWLALVVEAGDVVILDGDLGGGKTTFARALIGALADGGPVEVPSPTFSIVQTYDETRVPVAHYDLYRLSGPEEAAAIGLVDGFARAVTLIEWADRAAGLLPVDRIVVRLTELAGAGASDADTGSGVRTVEFVPGGAWGARLDRLGAMIDLACHAGLATALPSYLAGDASRRRYGRLRESGRTAVLMDWPAASTPPPIVRDGKSYGEIAHSADDPAAFVAIGRELKRLGLSVPDILGEDVANRLLLLEDLGDTTFAAALSAGVPMLDLYSAAADVLLELARHTPPPLLPVDRARTHQLARFDRPAIEIELSLLTDWYWPFRGRGALPEIERQQFDRLWHPLVEKSPPRRPNGCCVTITRRTCCGSPIAPASAGSASSISRMRCAGPPPTTSRRCCRTRGSTCRRRSRPRCSAVMSPPAPRWTPDSTRRRSRSTTPSLAPSARPRYSASSHD